MHLRRALLLFAIVLGLAAIAASVSRQPEESSSPPPRSPAATEPEAPTVEPRPVTGAGAVTTIELDAGPRERVRVDAGQPITLEVSVAEPGLVEIPMLGLSAFGEPLTPARFELFPSDTGRIEVKFTPVDTDETETAGTLVVAEPEG